MAKALRMTLSVLALSVMLSYGAAGGTISGTVRDPAGAPFKGAFVRARNAKTKIAVYVLSDKEGHYQITDLSPGEYGVQAIAVGYKSDPRSGVKLNAGQSVSLGFPLQKGMVRWSDLSAYQATKLLPDGKGKEVAFGVCMACHQFQTLWAATRRDEPGWRSAVKYMLTAKRYFFPNGLPDGKEENLVSYLNGVFGVDSDLPRSPAELPQYAEVKHPEFSDEAMKIVYVEYRLPGPSRFPWSAYPDNQGNLWMPYYNGNVKSVGKLDPKTGEVQEWRATTPGYGAMHSAVPAPDGTVWMAEATELNQLVELDSRTGTITEFSDTEGPKALGHDGRKHTCRVDAQRNAVWCTGGPVARFDRGTKKFTAIADVADAYGIELDKDGNAWIASSRGGYIAKVDANTLKAQKWMLPDTKSEPRRIKLDSQGNAWVGEHHGGKLARLDPKTGTIKEYPLPAPRGGPYGYLLGPDRTLPGPSVGPYALGVDREGFVWYSSAFTDVIGRLDPKTGAVVEYPFPYSENTLREFNLDSEGKMWFASPANNIAGYFTLTEGK